MTKNLLRHAVAAALVFSASAGTVCLLAASPAYADSRSDFIEAVVPAAQQSESDYGVPASVTIAQAVLESGWGQSGLATRSSNYFGIKCGSSGPGPFATGCRDYPTQECTPACHTVTASFRVYTSLQDSVRDHGHLLRDSPRYANAFDHTDDPDQFITDIWTDGYATDPDYPKQVIALMRAYDLYQYDADPLSLAATADSADAVGNWAVSTVQR